MNLMFKLWKSNDPIFEKIFRRHASNSLIASREFLALFGDIENTEKYYKRIVELEEINDDIVKECHQLMDETFITKIDKSDIAGLIQKLDDIIDGIKTTASKVLVYRVTKLQKEVGSLAAIVTKMIGSVDDLLKEIHNLTPQIVKDGIVIIKELEEEADQILHTATQRIFKEESNAKSLIQWKDIFETMEGITDSSEDVADLINSISRKGT